MAKEEQAPAEAGAEGGGKKKLIIIGAAVAAALIIGVVAFMMLGGKGDKKTAKEGEAAQTEGGHGAPAAGGHGAAAPAAGAAGPSANIFPLDPFIVNIYDGQELRYLKVKVELEMVSPAIKTEIEGRLAPIRDAILILLSAKTLADVQDVQGKNTLKDEILGAINKNIPPGKISKVYFTDFVVQ
ncbi:MAG: flagellar basal body-associated FliL family protein [Desulfuromonadaceae bacterium]|nr:flagellar basal body-associated FliL family protein [Desulfuromonadaceae bacterium]MDD5104031.1 flagellar basal body-associated FliL family protein [Desulfuromonadaceae bacterium]